MQSKTKLLVLLCLIPFIGFAQSTTEYELVWADEFNDASPSPNPANWNFETGGSGWGNRELQYYTNRTENVRVENGNLVIEALLENYGSNAYTSGRITTKNKAKIRYGKIEARISLPSGQGTWPAFWMMPNDNVYGSWPLSGEIDMMEHVGSDPNMVSFAVHTYYKNGSKGNNWHSQITPSNVEGNFHEYGIEWFDDRILFFFDGVKQVTLWRNLSEDYRGWPFDQDFFVILNLAIGGTMGGTVDNAIFSNPVKMEVDYVRIYRQKVATSAKAADIGDLAPVPNPFTDFVRFNNSSDADVAITDASGKTLVQTRIGPNGKIGTAHLPPGLYLARITGNGLFSVKKLVKR
ncbi:MAG: family 16 glycosylhydrolase [Breznakibacter sp.]